MVKRTDKRTGGFILIAFISFLVIGLTVSVYAYMDQLEFCKNLKLNPNNLTEQQLRNELSINQCKL